MSGPIDTVQTNPVHPVHGGTLMPTHCGQTTLDAIVLDLGIDSISLVKIDTDGHEFAVLNGFDRLPVDGSSRCDF